MQEFADNHKNYTAKALVLSTTCPSCRSEHQLRDAVLALTEIKCIDADDHKCKLLWQGKVGARASEHHLAYPELGVLLLRLGGSITNVQIDGDKFFVEESVLR